MERKELYDVPNNSAPLEQELSLEDFGDCELKSKPICRNAIWLPWWRWNFLQRICQKRRFWILYPHLEVIM